jgi:hypothetical protein
VPNITISSPFIGVKSNPWQYFINQNHNNTLPEPPFIAGAINCNAEAIYSILMKNDGVTRALALVGLAAPPLLILFIIIAAAVTPGYSHISDTVNRLGAQDRPYPWIMGAGFVLYGLQMVCLTCGLYRFFTPVRHPGL